MRTKRLARAAGGGIAYATLVLLGATLFGQTTVSAEHAFPYTGDGIRLRAPDGHNTVKAVRADLEAGSEIPKVDRVFGLDGNNGTGGRW